MFLRHNRVTSLRKTRRRKYTDSSGCEIIGIPAIWVKLDFLTIAKRQRYDATGTGSFCEGRRSPGAPGCLSPSTSLSGFHRNNGSPVESSVSAINVRNSCGFKCASMPASLKYGASASLEIDLPENALVANWTGPSSNGESAIAAATSAVQTPLDFPQLKQATVPGDHVVLALEPGVPQAEAVVAAIIPALLGGGVAVEDITVVRTHADIEAQQIDPRSALPDEQRSAVQLAVHEAGDEDQLAFLAADSKGKAIYLNRQMCEADLVIPIGYLRPDACAHRSGRHGIWNSNVYPTFGDRKTIDHFAANGVPLTPGQLSHRQKQIDQVAWLLGVQVTAQIVPGTGDSAWQVLFGSPAAVFPQGWTLCRRAWQMDASRKANLVVAGIGGGPAQQTWANVGHALKTAISLVNDGGAIVICTELESTLGPALRLIADSGDLESAAPRLRKLHSPDADVASLLIETQERVRIYLLSNLGEDIVESVGFGYIQSPAEITRLAKHHDSCILLPDAQYGRPLTTN